MTIRLCKTALVAMMALFFAVVVFGNLTDYQTNASFVEHVLAMDTIFPDSTLKWRAVTDKQLVTLAYWAIIGWEILTAAILSVAAVRLALACRDQHRFLAAKPLGTLGLSFGLLLYGFGITIIGGEWFAMWQSKVWNGLDSAARFILLDGLVLLILLGPEA
jgi:predicted small integral membrane protein